MTECLGLGGSAPAGGVNAGAANEKKGNFVVAKPA